MSNNSKWIKGDMLTDIYSGNDHAGKYRLPSDISTLPRVWKGRAFPWDKIAFLRARGYVFCGFSFSNPDENTLFSKHFCQPTPFRENRVGTIKVAPYAVWRKLLP